jgi:ABC-type branched-subunit amino acid transport system substrate-binding protein
MGWLVLASLLAPSAAIAADPEAPPVTTAVERGKAVYMTGKGATGVLIQATVASGLSLPASLYPCSGCHGTDARGGVEAGVSAPSIRWSHLVEPAAVKSPAGSTRPPYEESSFARALRDGRDSAGRAFDPVMPRYAIDDRDLADLVAFLRAIETAEVSGVDAATIRIASLMPLGEPRDPQAASIEALLTAYFARIDAAEPIHGRRIEFIAIDAGSDVSAALQAQLAAIRGSEPPFAFLANAGPGADRRVLAELSAKGIPVVGPLTFDEADQGITTVFQVLPTWADQARAAARLLSEARVPRAALVVEPGRTSHAMGEAFLAEAEERGLPVDRFTVVAGDVGDIAARLADRQQNDVVVLGSGEFAARFAAAAKRLDWKPRLVASGVLAGGRLGDSGLETRLFWPPGGTLPAHPDADAFETLLASLPEAARAPRERIMQMAAYSAAALLVDTIQRTGRDLTRNSLVDTLSRTQGFDSGLMPEISFGPTRRTGIRGAFVTGGDTAGQAVEGRWIEVGQTSP